MLSKIQLDVLAFAPHPDDAEIFCGGFLAKMVKQGHAVGIVDLTRGELGSRGTPEIRAKEVAAATKVLGLAYRDNLGLPDGGIDPYSNNSEQLLKVVAAIRQLRPELLLLPYPSGRHPDHSAASTLTSRAVFFARNNTFKCGTTDAPFGPKQVLYYQERFQFTPSFVVDITSVSDLKFEAIRCYSSQVGPTVQGPKTLVGSPLSLEAMAARDKYYGAMIGTKQAEPFLMRNVVRIDDPLLHLRSFHSSEQPEALFYPEEQ